jgi:hypothetical protein
MEEPLLYITEVFSLYKTIIHRQDISAVAENGILFMARNNLNVDWINDLPWSIALPIWEILRIGKTTPGMHWPIQAYSLIDRMDIAAQLELGHRSVIMNSTLPEFRTVSRSAFSILPRLIQVQFQMDDQLLDHDAILAQVKSTPRFRSNMLEDKQKRRKLSVPNMRFTGDRRLWDVEALLQTTRTRPIKPDDKPQLRLVEEEGRPRGSTALTELSLQRGRAGDPTREPRSQYRLSDNFPSHWIRNVHPGFERAVRY